jgi:hypothetical protein
MCVILSGVWGVDFRYQLTCIGGFAPVYIAQEIQNNHFKIAGGRPSMKVSWQVTGIRQDPYMKMHPLQVEEEKAENEKGFYLTPEAYGKPESLRITNARKKPDATAAGPKIVNQK